jgi:hypothetical protein
MANYITLKTAIQTTIKTNGNNEITGKILQQQLLAMINSLGSDYQLAGTLRPADTPKTDDQRIVYLAVEPGMYEHAGGFEVTELSLLTYGAEWHMYPLGVPFGGQIAEDITAAVDAEKTRATTAEAALTKKINTEAFQRKNADAALYTRATAIEDKIPAQASSENKLADKEFVNSSIATATATFRGTFNTLEALKATQADKNDYAFWVHKDEDGNTCYDKYTYTDTEWKFEYRLNNSSFTTAQWAALNSGVTADVIKALQDTDKANAKAIADEKATREQADTTLQGNINAEKTRATTAEATLTKRINTEAFERKSADATLQENIDKKQDIISDLTTIRTQAATAYGWGDHSEAGYLTGITKAMVEGVLTGNITSHTHSYLPLSGGMMTNTDKVTNLNADLLDGYDASSFAKVASANNLISSNNEFTFVPSDFTGELYINYKTTGGANGAITKYHFCNGTHGVLATISQGQFSGNAASSSKWSTARTITLTGSVTGSVSIDGSQNVSLATTTNHTHTFASLTDKPTTISGYGITDAYTKTETDNKVAVLQNLLDSMFERVYDSNNKLIRIHSNVTISSSGDLVAGGSAEGGGTSGGAYTQLEWNAIKALTQSESGLLASAYAVKEAYTELNTAIETLAGKATNVKFTQTIKSGKQIGTISIDGKSTSLYAPANYAWSEITGKPSFATVATSGSYTDLANKPTIASLMGSTAIGGTSSYLYWNGSAWATKALGSNAFTSISKVSQLTNDSGYVNTEALATETAERKAADATLQENIDKKQDIISDLTTIRTQAATAYGWGDHSEAGYLTGITKAMVEGVLTGNITSHTHSYLPLSGGMMTNTDKVTNLNADLLDGYDASSFAKVASANNLISSNNEFTFVPSDFTGELYINYKTTGGANGAITKYHFCNGTHGVLATISQGQFSGNAASSSKWSTARTITLTGSVTGSVSIDGSQNVSLATTTNHTHTFASLTDKPTTISGYGITDAYTASTIDSKLSGYLPLSGGTITGALKINTPSDRSIILDEPTGEKYHMISFRASGEEYSYLCAYNTGSENKLLFNGSTILHSGNYNSYSPKLNGTGASGTWGINISGNASKALADKNGNDITTYYAPKNLVLGTTGVIYNPADSNASLSHLAAASYGIDNSVCTVTIYQRVTSDGEWVEVAKSSYLSGSALEAYKSGNLVTLYRGARGAALKMVIASPVDNYIKWLSLYAITKDSTYSGNIDCSSEGVTVPIGTWGSWLTVPYIETGYRIETTLYFNLEHKNAVVYLGGVRIVVSNPTSPIYPGKSHTCYSADKLANSRTIWGQSFDGTGNVSGALTGVTSITASSTIQTSGNIIAGGDLIAGSDIRYKDKIQDLRLSVHDIALAPAFTYKWNNREDDALVHIGSSAQYWLNTDAKDAVYYDKQNDFYHLNYASLALCNTIILARGMETQEEKIARLEARINELEDKLRQYDCSR